MNEPGKVRWLMFEARASCGVMKAKCNLQGTASCILREAADSTADVPSCRLAYLT